MTEHEPRWHWRNCREVAFSVELWPMTWRFGFDHDEDVYGGRRTLCLGPLGLTMHFNIGNVSSESRFRAALGLCEVEAYERAYRYEGVSPDA